MIKRVDEITISDLDRVERYGEVSHFKKIPLIPTIFVAKKIQKVLDQLLSQLNGDTEFMEDEEWRILSEMKINLLRLYYYGALNILENETRVNNLKRHTKKKRKDLGHLNIYIKGIQDLTGIEVKDLKDLRSVRKDIEFKTDKYNENFGQSQTKEPTGVVSMSAGIFLFLGMDFQPNMRILHLIELRNLAQEKWQKLMK